MLRSLIDLIKLKLLTSRWLTVFSWFGRQETQFQINPTVYFNLVGTLTDKNGFSAERGLHLEKGKTDLMYKIFWDLILTINQCKGDTNKEQALLKNLPAEVMHMLKDLDLIVSKDKAPQAVQFAHTINSEQQNAAAPKTELTLNPKIYMQTEQAIPLAVVDHFAEKFKGPKHILENAVGTDRDLVWVIDPASEFLAPMYFDPIQLQKLKAVISGSAIDECFSESEIAQLLDHKVLINQSEVKEAQEAFKLRLEQSKQQLTNEYYTVFKSPFAPLQAQTHSKYFKTVADSGVMKPNCLLVPNRKFIHNQEYCHFMHFQLNAVLAQITQEPTKPSFSYLAYYMPGSILKKHIDRDQCKWNVSMPLYVNEKFDKAWPIYLQRDANDESSTVEVALDVGDMVIYRGSKMYHWREMLEEGKYSSMCFFHFVDESFTGKLD